MPLRYKGRVPDNKDWNGAVSEEDFENGSEPVYGSCRYLICDAKGKVVAFFRLKREIQTCVSQSLLQSFGSMGMTQKGSKFHSGRQLESSEPR